MKLLRLLLVPFALVCVAVIRLARGYIRIGVMLASRLGHFAGNTEVYLCESKAERHLDIWIADAPANTYLLKMWRRVLRIDRTAFALIVLKVNRLFDGWQKYEVPQGNWDRDVNNLFEKYPPHLNLTTKEERRGEQTLREMGIPAGSKWVCLIVRDSAYLPGLGYHSYRDSDIDTYGPAALELARRGYYVFRMGAKVHKPFITDNPKIIDFPYHPLRSDFLSIYIGAKCEFCVSTGTGFDGIPYIFRRPICYVNYVPLECLSTFVQGSLAIWKHHVKDGKRMTPAEIYASGAGHFMTSREFSDAGITLEDNTPQEIADVVVEMAEGRKTDPQAFWESFPRSESTYTKRPLHGEIRMRIGDSFLRSYQ